MNYTIILDEKEFKLEIIKKDNIKHIYLKIIDQNKLQIRTNKWIDNNYLLEFVQKKSDWIQKKSSNLPLKNIDTNKILFLGKKYEKNEILDKYKDEDSFYKNQAPNIIIPIVNKFSNIMELYPLQIKFRKNKTRWGSCSSKNNINLNTELLKYDIRFIEYVVVHELAHIKHKNHRKEFWNLVEKFMPDFQQRRKLYRSSY